MYKNKISHKTSRSDEDVHVWINFVPSPFFEVKKINQKDLFFLKKKLDFSVKKISITKLKLLQYIKPFFLVQTTWVLNPWEFLPLPSTTQKKQNTSHLCHPLQVQEQQPQRVFCSAVPSPWVFRGVHPGAVVICRCDRWWGMQSRWGFSTPLNKILMPPRIDMETTKKRLRYQHPQRGAKWFLRGVNSPSLRV